MKDVLVMHVHATSKNKGDEALLISVLKLIGTQDLKVIDVCTAPESYPQVAKFLNIKNVRNFSQFYDLISSLNKADAVLLGGGDVITASNNLFLLALARILKTPVYCVGVGINLKHVSKLSMLFLKYGISNISTAFIRDTNSAQKAVELGLESSKIVEVSDLTFVHGADSLAPNYKEASLDLPPKYVAVSMRAPEFNSSKWGDNEYRNIATALDKVINQYKMQVVFISMADEYKTVTKVADNKDEFPDSLVCQKIQSYMVESQSTQVISSAVSLNEIMSVFDRAKFSICCRLHAKIFSTLVGTPFVGLTYNLKSGAYMRDAGMEEFSVPLSSISVDALFSKISLILDDYDAAENKTKISYEHLSKKAKGYLKLQNQLQHREASSSWRLLHPKVWFLYLINSIYEIYAKYS